MTRVLTLLLLAFVVWADANFAAFAASDPCKDCNAAPELTIREQIKADRAREAERVAKESSDRPWDGKDLGGVKRTTTPAVVR
jgi:hypothetical protein